MKLHCRCQGGIRGIQLFLKLSQLSSFIYHQPLGLNIPKLFINNKLPTFLFLFIFALTKKTEATQKRNTLVQCFRGQKKKKELKKCFNDFVVSKETFNYVPLFIHAAIQLILNWNKMLFKTVESDFQSFLVFFFASEDSNFALVYLFGFFSSSKKLSELRILN